jgi:D-alanyl-D-alanine carboxypeptidase (penicillin-binding protein 5/6)
MRKRFNPNHRALSRSYLGVLLGALVLTAALAGPARAIETKAREAVLLDVTTGAILLEKNADTAMPTASMSKIMTVFMVFERLKDGRLSLDDKLLVSENAWRKGGSKMYVQVGDQIRVEDLLRGVIVQSGNDASIVLAEGLGGTEESFGEEMTDKGKEIGLSNSSFANATGWPDPNHWMTANDLATLALRTIQDFPDYYHYYGETEFTWSEIRQGNRNPLLYKDVGADGLKTGHTEEAGYGLTGSALRDDRRLILVVNGLQSVRERTEESVKLINWGFREFGNYTLFKAGETVEEAAVWLGDLETVPLVPAEDLTVTLSRKDRKEMPVPAPIQRGQEVATLVIKTPDGEPIERPLVAGEDVALLGPISRLVSGLKFIVMGEP